MLTRLIRWLRGIPSPDHLDAHVRHSKQRDRQKTDAIREADRSNLGGGVGGGLSGSSGGLG